MFSVLNKLGFKELHGRDFSVECYHQKVDGMVHLYKPSQY